jgi:hypothetical protein
LRDVFTMLFFVSVGMLLDPAFLVENVATVALVVLLVFAVKGLLFAGVVRAFGYGNIVPFAVGLGLFQVGVNGVGCAQGVQQRAKPGRQCRPGSLGLWLGLWAHSVLLCLPGVKQGMGFPDAPARGGL